MGGRFSNPATTQSPIVVRRHAMATVYNFKGDQNNQHDITSLRFAKTKELQSNRTSRHTNAAHLFLPQRR